MKSELDRCPKCGGDCYAYAHTPCSDHPELATTTDECNECDWYGNERPSTDEEKAYWRICDLPTQEERK